MSAPTVTDHLPIALRAFATPQFTDVVDRKEGKPRRKASKAPASEWALVFDTETTTDPGQALRFGTYQVRKSGELHEEGIFFDPEGVTNAELEALREYANNHELQLLSRDQFADDVFYRIGYFFRGTIIGFNLPFDISRIAIAHNSARGEMRGGFTFRISRRKSYPHLRVKHVSARSAFMRFARPMRQTNPRGARKRGITKGSTGGHLLELKALAGGLYSRSFSLRSLSKTLEVPHPKLEFDKFSGPVSEDMIGYAVRDVQTTWECYEELCRRFGELGLENLTPEKVYSEASIGKGYLRDMGIVGWRKLQPDFPLQTLANIMSTYFGGRSEVRIRRDMRQVMLCDFLSMYPTVCVLMGLWRLVIAQGLERRDATPEARQLLDTVDLAELQSPSFWRGLATLVRVKPDEDIFPVRAKYSGEAQSTIGTNFLSFGGTLWFTLADCVASKLLTGKAPEILEATAFAPGPIQPDLKPININGDSRYRVDPANDDFFKRVIELRQSIKRQSKTAPKAEREKLNSDQYNLKIAANATSYGIYMEVNVVKRNDRFPVTVLSSTSRPFSFKTDKAEEPGPYFHPVLATLITGAARLMLAAAERMVVDSGLEWTFCDTDSIAVARPVEMDAKEFEERVKQIVDWFSALNPYEFGGSILKIEDQNYSLDEIGKLEPLYCWAVSAKRYALFNLPANNRPSMRKVSAHGLGHLLAPYGADDAPAGIPEPHPSVLESGIERWHSDLWFKIVSAALDGHPDVVDRDYHPALASPAVSRYGATTPDLLRWFKPYNAKRPYRQQVKPFGFLLSLQASMSADEEIIDAEIRRRRKGSKQVKPIALFERDVAELRVFDRMTGKPVKASLLKPYSDALAAYHIHPESKFLNGDYLDRGPTQRRHVKVTAVQHIGKEANDWERQAVLGLDVHAQPIYGVGAADPASLSNDLRPMIERWGITACARAFGISAATLRSAVEESDRVSERSLQLFASRLPEAKCLFQRVDEERRAEIEGLRALIDQIGLRSAARRLGMDPSNLGRKLRRAERVAPQFARTVATLTPTS